MKIGVGVTTYKRPEMLKKFLESLEKYSSYDYVLHIAEDTDEDRRGVAARKNECLRALEGVDHYFLFDDDVSIIKKGWEDFFINSGQEHLLFLNDNYHGHNYFEIGDVRYYKDCGGVFLYMTKECVERVGAFDERFCLWGFEHANYSIRIIGEHGKYPMLAGTEEYLYSEDYSNPNHKSSITNIEKEKLFKKNIRIFTQPIINKYIPL